MSALALVLALLALGWCSALTVVVLGARVGRSAAHRDGRRFDGRSW